MTAGNLAAWKIKEGDAINADMVIAEVETDKATVDYEAVDDGFLAKILVPEGCAGALTRVALGHVLAAARAEGFRVCWLNQPLRLLPAFWPDARTALAHRTRHPSHALAPRTRSRSPYSLAAALLAPQRARRPRWRARCHRCG